MKKGLLSLLIPVFCLAACTPAATPTANIQPTEYNTAIPTRPVLEETPVPEKTTAVNSIARPFPQHTIYAAGSLLPNHRTQEQLDQDVLTFYDYWKTTYVIQDGADNHGLPLYRIAFGKSDESRANTVSEGQGFGMIILPVMAGYDPDAQIIFDGLWRFARAHPSEVDSRLMDWSLEEEEGNDSAFDGDADIAFGLLMADAQWGSQGTIHYKAEAETLIAGILKSTIGPQSRLPTLGDWVEFEGEKHNQYTPRSSDFMLVNFRAYGKATGDKTWDEVVSNSQNVMTGIQTSFSQKTGLIPDFIVLTGDKHVPEPAPADFLEGPDGGHYYYNAGRVPWRVGSDSLLYGDPASTAISRKISLWAESVSNGDPGAFRSGYDLEGNALDGSDYFTTFFVAPLGLAAMTSPTQQTWLNTVYDSVFNIHEDYYEDTVNLLCLITMTGNAWAP